MLRLMAWLCTSTDDRRFKNSQTCIITGPNIEMAIKLIKRLKQIFEPKLGLYFSNKETVLELNGCSIEAYPSNHIDSFWSLEILNSFYWMKLTSLERENRRKLDMFQRGTLANQTPTSLWYQQPKIKI